MTYANPTFRVTLKEFESDKAATIVDCCAKDADDAERIALCVHRGYTVVNVTPFADYPALPRRPRACSAYVRDPNTPESDAQSHVWHLVHDTFSLVHEVWATDPCDAIDRFNQQQGV